MMRLVFRLAELHFKLSVTEFEKANFKKSNRLINKAVQSINNFTEYNDHYGLKYPKMREYAESKGQNLFRKIKKHQVLTQANLEICQGKIFFDDAVNNKEKFDTECFMCALDAFNRARKLASGLDAQIEARAEGLIGNVWFRALYNPVKAWPHL